jgi:putative chitinase
MKISNLSTKLKPEIITEIESMKDKFNITNNLRLAHFLAQCSHESANFTLVYENLNYSAKGLRTVFGKYFPTDALAKQYERQPEKIGNRVYASRMGNGDEASKEPFKFRGRGYIQLTGKDNYKLFGEFIGEDLINNPDLVATKYPLTSAAFFFNRNKLWDICDKGATEEVVKLVTRRVNGGTIGLEDRISKFSIYHKLLS